MSYRKQVALFGLVFFIAVFLFCIYVAFTLCGWCLTNPNATSPGRLPWEKSASTYWDIDGEYAAIAFFGILISFYFYLNSLYGTLQLACVIVVAYEISLILFDYRDLATHATNFQLSYPLISWITNRDLLLIGAAAGTILEIGRRIKNWKQVKLRHG